jgi:uncharacterized protein YndB with AHSA1/START domain
MKSGGEMATAQRVPAGPTIQIRRLFDAAPERLFDAWTESAQVAQWLCRKSDYKTEHLRFDGYAGGHFHIRNTSPSGDVYDICGEFREVRPFEKIAFTWGGKEALASGVLDKEMPTEQTLVVVEFIPHGKQTEVVLTHYGLPTEDLRNDHTQGWKICLDNLEGFLSA